MRFMDSLLRQDAVFDKLKANTFRVNPRFHDQQTFHMLNVTNTTFFRVTIIAKE